MTIPIITPYCAPRSRANYLALVNAFNVEHNPIYQPGYMIPRGTWCDRYLSDVSTAFDCPIPFVLASEQVSWLASLTGKAAGWVELMTLSTPQGIVTVETQAIARVELGFPTVAVWANPNPKLHGHVAVVVPADPLVAGVHVSAAGGQCFRNALVSRSFGQIVPRYFSHA